MNQIFAFTFVAFFAGKTLAEFHDRLCSKIPISYKLINDHDSIEPGLKLAANELKDRILQRYCDNNFLTDFVKPSQNLTIILNNAEIPPKFFKYAEYGERFLMTNPSIPNDVGVNISLVPEILNLSHEDALKYHMYPAVINRRNQLKTLEGGNGTYIEVMVGGFKFQDPMKRERVQLVPGWVIPLKGKEIIAQTLIPGPNSVLKEQKVYVVANWLNVNESEGLHATAHHQDSVAYVRNHDYITIFYDKPPAFKDSPVKVTMKDREGIYMQGVLEPGWFSELDHVTKQKLTIPNAPRNRGNPKIMNVTVYPGVNHVKPENGIAGSVPFNSGNQWITIYYTEENPESILDNRKGMSMKVDMVYQAGQEFSDRRVVLSPGWIGVLDRTVEATMTPEPVKDHKSDFVEQEVTVSVGWQQFKDNSSFTAFYYVTDVRYPISIHLKNATII